MPLDGTALAPPSSPGRGSAVPAILVAVTVCAVALAALLLLAAPGAVPEVEAPIASQAAPGEATARIEPAPPPAAPVEAAPVPSVAVPPPEGATASAGEEVSGTGALPRAEIRRILQQGRARYRACYERGLARNPALAGRVKVRFVIGRDGSVSGVTDAGSDLPDSNVVACVLRALTATRFPRPEGGEVTIVYPLLFAPG